jgi:SRSO17 transposase
VPAEGPLQTKPEIAMTLRDHAHALGVTHRGVVADADDGASPNGLEGLEARQAQYVVGVCAAFQVSL